MSCKKKYSVSRRLHKGLSIDKKYLPLSLEEVLPADIEYRISRRGRTSATKSLILGDRVLPPVPLPSRKSTSNILANILEQRKQSKHFMNNRKSFFKI